MKPLDLEGFSGKPYSRKSDYWKISAQCHRPNAPNGEMLMKCMDCRVVLRPEDDGLSGRCRDCFQNNYSAPRKDLDSPPFFVRLSEIMAWLLLAAGILVFGYLQIEASDLSSGRSSVEFMIRINAWAGLFGSIIGAALLGTLAVIAKTLIGQKDR